MGQLFTQTYTSQTTSWLVHSWSTFSHEQTQIHKTHHGLDLGKAIIFPLMVFFVSGHEANTQMSKFPKLWFPQLWKPITLCVDFQLRLRPKQNCSPCQKLFNGMWHVTYMRVNQGNFLILLVGNQIGNLIHDLFIGHNSCFKWPNGSCEPISYIYILWVFSWYKGLFNSMNFDPYNCILKILDSIRTPTPKMGTHLGVWGFVPSHCPTFPGTWNVTPKLHSWPTILQTLASVTSPWLGLWH